MTWLREFVLRWAVRLALLPGVDRKPTKFQLSTLSLAVVLTGGVQGGRTVDLTLTLSDTNNGNWADAVQTQTATGPDITLSFSDDLNNWADSLLGDFRLLLGDSADNWADEIQTVMLLLLEAEDDLNNWVEALETGYGLLPEDDLNNWVEALSSGFGIIIVDDLDNWADSLSSVYNLIIVDDLDNWAEALSLGYGLAVVDDADNLADAAEVSLQGDAALQLILSDTGAALWQSELFLLEGFTDQVTLRGRYHIPLGEFPHGPP